MNIVKTLRKEEPRLIKLPNGTVMCVLSFLLFFFFSPKSPSYFGKLMRLNRKRSEISATYCIGNRNYVSFRTFNNEKPIEVAISSKSFAPYATLSLTLMHSFSS